jgi:putative ABC transport system permease protein
VETPRGPASVPLAGVYLDYGREQGAALVDLATLAAAFGPGPVQSVALYLQPGADPEAVVDRIRAEHADRALRVRSNRRLRRDIMDIFDQTFAITGILRAMSLLIAAAGIALTLLVAAREKVAELALYRALGSGRGQIFRVFVGKGLGIVLMGLVLGALGGAALALILVYVINRAYFGWTIRLHWPWGDLAAQALVIVAVGTLAALYPALRASRTPATELSRDNVA